MKRINSIALALLTGIALSGCDWQGNQTIIGTGDVESMDVQLPGFEGVGIEGTCNVEILIGEPQSVTFYAQPEILEVLTYKVKNGILQIGFKPDCSVNTSEEISARIVIPSLSFAAVTGAGDFILSGDRQALLDIHITGTGNLKAFEMEVKECNIRISGAGNCEVNVIDNLDVKISGMGNVWYKGSPSLTTDVSGVGNVVPVTL